MAVSDHDLERLRRAIALAARGRFGVEPNPPVGCVLDRDGCVVGEGWHEAWGGPHAEVVALRRAGEVARGATAYVSLEPCSRVSKTGACTTALRDAGVRRVVFASADPNMPEDGTRALRDAGVEVEGPALADEGAPLLARFLRALGRPRPWVICKWAMSADGRIAPAVGRGGRLTGPEAAVYVHDLRAHCDAVAVGIGTVLADDPRLTVRRPPPDEGAPPTHPAPPIRVVFDTRLRTPPTARLFEDMAAAPVVIVAAAGEPARAAALERAGAEIVRVGDAGGGVDLAAALERLGERGVRRLLVEGGARLHGSLLGAGLADQVLALVAPRVLGGEEAVPAVSGTGFTSLDEAPRLEETTWRVLGQDLLLGGYVGEA